MLRRVLEEHEPDIRDAGLKRSEHVRGRRVAEVRWRAKRGGGMGDLIGDGNHVDGSRASVGLKLANTWTRGGTPPRSLTGAVKWPAVTKTRSRHGPGFSVWSSWLTLRAGQTGEVSWMKKLISCDPRSM
jgi:hypothetical protein